MWGYDLLLVGHILLPDLRCCMVRAFYQPQRTRRSEGVDRRCVVLLGRCESRQDSHHTCVDEGLMSPRGPKKSTTVRTRDLFEKHGGGACWTIGTVERKTGPVSVDLFGFIDQIAIGDGHHFCLSATLGIQTTVADKVNERVKKIAGLRPQVEAWLNTRTGSREIVVLGWRYLKRIGKWEPKGVVIFDYEEGDGMLAWRFRDEESLFCGGVGHFLIPWIENDKKEEENNE